MAVNRHALAAFVTFGILLALWVGLDWLNLPRMADVLDFVKAADATAWTAAALFFDLNPAKAGQQKEN